MNYDKNLMSLVFTSVILSIILIETINFDDKVFAQKENKSIVTYQIKEYGGEGKKLDFATNVTDIESKVSAIFPQGWLIKGKANYFASGNIIGTYIDGNIVVNIDIREVSKKSLQENGEFNVNSSKIKDAAMYILTAKVYPLDEIKTVERGDKYTIDGNPAFYVVQQRTPYMGKPYGELSVLTVKDNQEIQYTFSTEPDKFLEDRPIAENILNSIQLLDKQNITQKEEQNTKQKEDMLGEKDKDNPLSKGYVILFDQKYDDKNMEINPSLGIKYQMDKLTAIFKNIGNAATIFDSDVTYFDKDNNIIDTEPLAILSILGPGQKKSYSDVINPEISKNIKSYGILI